MSLAEQLTALLVAERNRRGWSQKYLAARMDRQVSFVQKIEYNTGDRQASGFDRYAAALGMDIKVELVPLPTTE